MGILSAADGVEARSDVPWITESAEQQLIVEWHRDTGDLPLLSEEIVEAVNRPATSDQAREVVRTLGNPAFAKLLIDRNVPVERVRELDAKDPEVRILQFVLVTYRTEADALRALESLRRDSRIRSVDPNLLLDYAVAPTDPLYANVSTSLRQYQWGPQANGGSVTTPERNLQAAWDLVRGTAYVAVLDNGIQTEPAVHPDLTQNYRPQFSENRYSGDIYAIDEMAGVPSSPGWAGHGTHVAGIVAANTTHPGLPSEHPNPPAAGGAGVCWYCSLMIFRVTAPSTGSRPQPSMANTAAAIARAAQGGAQVINLSFGRTDSTCSLDGDNQAVCTALQIAAIRSVVVVSAVGNSLVNSSTCIGSIIDFPSIVASVGAAPNQIPTTVIPVGAASEERESALSPHRPARWREGTAGNVQSNCGPDFATRGLMAPGLRIVSSVYSGRNWNPTVLCGDAPSFPGDPLGYDDLLGVGYGSCTGTSMAAPFITGVVGLMRSMSPRANAESIMTELLNTGSSAHDRTLEIGAGMVNALAAVQTQHELAGNRLTPLFSFYNSDRAHDHFYSVVPQMGSAARKGTMALRNTTLKTLQIYQSIGTLVANYVFPSADFPQLEARAQLWVFSTHVNPFGGPELRPLLRYSYACYEDVLYPIHRAICGQIRGSSAHIDHAYASTVQDGALLEAAGYRFDGIEGFLLPNAENANVVPVLRARNVTRDDWAVFPQSEQAAMVAQGYTADTSVLGYAYPNSGSQPSL